MSRSRPWPRVSWWYSIVLPIALLLLIVTILLNGFGDDPAIEGTVRDAYTGEPVSGARVSAGGTAVVTDDGGGFSFDTGVIGDLSVDRDSYEPTAVAVQPTDDDLDIVIRPTTLTGTVTNARTEEPVGGAVVSVEGESAASATTVTDVDGSYLLIDVPRDATVSVSYAGFEQASREVDNNVTLDFEIQPDTMSGVITDVNGQPIGGATVLLGDAMAVTDEDGSYTIGGIPESGSIVVKKAGYHEVVDSYPEDLVFNAQLEPFDVKAIYVTANTAGDDERWEALLDLIDETELNAVVLDVKDNSGHVRYDTTVDLAEEIGAERQTYDLESRMEDLADRDIYAIARLVAFEDPVLASARPDLAIQSAQGGGVWTTWDGQAWVNGMLPDVWNYNINLAVEVADAGFDEVQIDYVRFPTDGPLENAEYGTEFSRATRVEAVTEFLSQMRSELTESGVFLAVDVFGIAVWDESDIGIGHDLEAIAPHVDVINPMIYPSHFSPGQFGFDNPNDHPYDVVTWVLERAAERLGPDADKIRPWLQDFSYGVGIAYGSEQVRAQIDAADAFGTPGWMLWNADSSYTSSALESAP